MGRQDPGAPSLRHRQDMAELSSTRAAFLGSWLPDQEVPEDGTNGSPKALVIQRVGQIGACAFRRSWKIAQERLSRCSQYRNCPVPDSCPLIRGRGGARNRPLPCRSAPAVRDVGACRVLHTGRLRTCLTQDCKHIPGACMTAHSVTTRVMGFGFGAGAKRRSAAMVRCGAHGSGGV